VLKKSHFLCNYLLGKKGAMNMYFTQQVSIKRNFWLMEKMNFMKLMADDDEVFEVTAISEQLDLGRKNMHT
jgi:hypothetical protein